MRFRDMQGSEERRVEWRARLRRVGVKLKKGEGGGARWS
jgi:hypothetical protein